MRPETYRKRLEALRQRARDAKPPAPGYVFIGEHAELPENGKPTKLIGESRAECLARNGISRVNPVVWVEVVDASTPRPEEEAP